MTGLFDALFLTGIAILVLSWPMPASTQKIVPLVVGAVLVLLSFFL